MKKWKKRKDKIQNIKKLDNYKILGFSKYKLAKLLICKM